MMDFIILNATNIICMFHRLNIPKHAISIHEYKISSIDKQTSAAAAHYLNEKPVSMNLNQMLQMQSTSSEL